MANKLSENLDINQAIGQLLVFGFQGTEAKEDSVLRVREHLQGGRAGGVIFFEHNLTSPQQTKTLLRTIREVDAPLPVFTLIDQEGGKVQRLSSKNGFCDHPSAKELAEESDQEKRVSACSDLATELRSTGFNFNFAPCVDVEINPNSPAIGALGRSFGADIGTVVDRSREFISSLRRANVVSCLKHFPGHGSAKSDSHLGMTDITTEWQESELEPYRRLVSEKYVDAVMTAHVIHNKFDKDTPATLSKFWISKLREDIGFNGVVVSDDLHMGAIQQHFTFKEVVAKAILAGVNLLVFSNNPLAAGGVKDFAPDPDLPNRFASTVNELISEGTINETLIRESADRVLELKSRLSDFPSKE